jgi:predicted MFS family arabinose efflux permease
VIGRINWAYMLPYGLCALAYGPLTRLFNNKHINVASLILFSVFSLGSALAWSHTSLFVFRFLVGVVAAATTPLVLIYIADNAAGHERGKYVGLYFSATFVADLLGLLLSGFVPWRVMFFIPAGLGVVAALLTARSFPKTLIGEGEMVLRYVEAFRQPAILRVFAYIFFISIFYHGVRQWLGVYFTQAIGLTQAWVSGLLTIVGLAGVFGEALGGHAADRKGRIPTLKFGVLLMLVAAGCLVFAKSVVLLAVVMFAWGIGWTLNHAGLSTHLTDLDKRFMKEISSLNSSVRFVAGGLGVVIGGWIMQQSFTLGFIVYALLFAVLFLTTEKILKTPGSSWTEDTSCQL